MSSFRWLMSSLVIAGFLALGCAPTTEADADLGPGSAREVGARTALDEYVATPDPAYAWTLLDTLEGEGVNAHVLELVSQSWLNDDEVDRTLWKHWLTVFVPDAMEADTAFLYITGGDNDDPAPSELDPRFAAMAAATSSVVAELRMVPNQPLTYAGDETGRRWEDALIAYGWDRFLRGGREEWLARLPMTKSAVRAMDAVTELMAGDVGGGATVGSYVVAGGSKRGWTTWTTAAVDPRVVAIVPLVIDLLNVEASFEHHYQAYGFWAPAVKDYVEMDIMAWMGTDRYAELNRLVEPFEYRDRLTMPKLLINASGDQFFLPDSSQFYFDELPGEKHLRYVPNTGHSLGGTDAFDSVLAFYDAILDDRPRPGYTWGRLGDNGLEVQVDVDNPPSEVLLWQASNEEKRDFRVDVIGKSYTSQQLEDEGGGRYSAEVPSPASGWSAFFIELTYPSGLDVPFKFTTEVRVVPDTLPFESPFDVGAAGTAVVAAGTAVVAAGTAEGQ